jgi:putative protease
VQTNCNGCYNTIYNGKCLSLLKHSSEVKGLNPRNIRLDFTLEAKEETAQALTAFLDTFLHGGVPGLEFENYTMVHFKRGVD